MVVSVYQQINYGEEQRYSEDSIQIIAYPYNKKQTQSQIIDGVKNTVKALYLSTEQSRLHDLMKDVKVGDRVKVNSKYYTIKSIEGPIMLNYAADSRRKYIIEL